MSLIQTLKNRCWAQLEKSAIKLRWSHFNDLIVYDSVVYQIKKWNK